MCREEMSALQLGANQGCCSSLAHIILFVCMPQSQKR